MMKSAGILAVSMAAVNAISFVTTFKSINPYHQDGGAAKLKQRDYALDKFAPRFDGLRFIETLITAHR